MINKLPDIFFDNGDAYEHFMGVWSRLVGGHFIEWLCPEKNSSFADIGCGYGAFSVQIDQLCNPKKIAGIHPSEAQINYAKELNLAHPVISYSGMLCHCLTRPKVLILRVWLWLYFSFQTLK